jgi:hypothetical protein
MPAAQRDNLIRTGALLPQPGSARTLYEEEVRQVSTVGIGIRLAVWGESHRDKGSNSSGIAWP